MTMTGQPRAADYGVLAAFRYQLRLFLAVSETSARAAAGPKPQQHPLPLAIKGLAPQCPATIAALADRLQIQIAHATRQ
jgi:hypothetical protein